MSTPGALRPSAAYRWSKCPGSYALELLFPEDQESPAAREGTAAHFYVSEALAGRKLAVGALAPNGHPIDAEMIRHGDGFVAYVRRLAASGGAHASLRVETPVTMRTYIHASCEGTPDVFFLDGANRRVVIPDYKYGHSWVDPWRNPQLVCYFAGVLEGHELTWDDVASWDFTAAIYQPRNYSHGEDPLRTWTVKGPAIREIVRELAVAAQKAKSPNAPTVTGDHCTHCDARHACPAFRAVGGKVLDLAAGNHPLELTPDAIGAELDLIETAEKRLKALKDGLAAQAESLLRNGTPVRHWSLGYVQSRERWKVAAADVQALCAMYDVDARIEPKITPNQAREAGVDAAVIEAYSERPTGARKLVRATASQAAKAFGG